MWFRDNSYIEVKVSKKIDLAGALRMRCVKTRESVTMPVVKRPGQARSKEENKSTKNFGSG